MESPLFSAYSCALFCRIWFPWLQVVTLIGMKSSQKHSRMTVFPFFLNIRCISSTHLERRGCQRYALSCCVLQSLSRVWPFVTPWTAAHQVSLSFTISWSLLKLMSIELMMPSNHLILCRPLLILPSVFPSIRVFSHESVLYIRWPKYWSFSFSISLSNKYSGLISFRIDWFDLLAVEGTQGTYMWWNITQP